MRTKVYYVLLSRPRAQSFISLKAEVLHLSGALMEHILDYTLLIWVNLPMPSPSDEMFHLGTS